jgi:hypothetical protein
MALLLLLLQGTRYIVHSDVLGIHTTVYADDDAAGQKENKSAGPCVPSGAPCRPGVWRAKQLELSRGAPRSSEGSQWLPVASGG